MFIQCKCGREFLKTYSKFKDSQQTKCSVCSGQKYDHSYVKNFIEVESGSGCRLLSEEYINSSFKMELRCKCGEVFSTDFDTFKGASKMQCNKCGFSHYTYDEVKFYIESNSQCKLLNKNYINNSTKLSLKCGCGNIFKTDLTNFKHFSKKQCNECSIKEGVYKERFTYEQVSKLINNDSSGCSLVSTKYINSKSKIKIKCKCGNVFETTYGNFKSGKKQCGECSGRINWDYDAVKDYINGEKGNGCTLLSYTYNYMTEILDIQCSCGDVFQRTFACFLQSNKNCSACNNKVDRDYHSILNYINTESQTNYKLLTTNHGEFSVRRLLTIQCDRGHIYKTRFNKFYSGHRCPICIESNGEQSVRTYLNNKKIRFESEKTFNKLVGLGGGLLRYDFAILKCDKIVSLIEYDGEYHYRDIYEKQDFQRQQEHDRLKNDFAIQNNIPLLRIPYWDFKNVNIILDKWFENRGEIYA